VTHTMSAAPELSRSIHAAASAVASGFVLVGNRKLAVFALAAFLLFRPIP
jgi:hypothetical protein